VLSALNGESEGSVWPRGVGLVIGLDYEFVGHGDELLGEGGGFGDVIRHGDDDSIGSEVAVWVGNRCGVVSFCVVRWM